MDDATKADVAAWTGCVAGALTDTEFRAILHHAGKADCCGTTDGPAPPSCGCGT
jgi:hypothetical protein